MELHPYDGVERRFRHTDQDGSAGLGVVAQLLHLSKPPAADQVLYDLSFYSGGIGVIDHLGIKLIAADSDIWSEVTSALAAKTPEQALTDAAWAHDFRWLLTGEKALVCGREAAVNFINSERHEFQSICLSTGRIYFVEGSDVNYWVAIWGDDTTLNYLGYDQG